MVFLSIWGTGCSLHSQPSSPGTGHSSRAVATTGTAPLSMTAPHPRLSACVCPSSPREKSCPPQINAVLERAVLSAMPAGHSQGLGGVAATEPEQESGSFWKKAGPAASGQGLRENKATAKEAGLQAKGERVPGAIKALTDKTAAWAPLRQEEHTPSRPTENISF